MINVTIAIQIADEHIHAQVAPLDGYRMVRFEPREIDAGWYFDYGIECDLDISESERGLFAGAPGFIVHRADGKIEVISHAQWVELGLSKH